MQPTYTQEFIEESHKYSLPQLYEAFLTEHNTRKNLEKTISRLNLQAARDRAVIRALHKDIDKLKSYEDQSNMASLEKLYFEEKYISTHILNNIPIEGDPHKSIEEYFSKPVEDRFILHTPSGGYICIYLERIDNEPFYYNISFMWHNPLKTRKEMTDLYNLIKEFYEIAEVPILYTGTNNVARRHSAIILNDEDYQPIYMLTLDNKWDNEVEHFKELFKGE